MLFHGSCRLWSLLSLRHHQGHRLWNGLNLARGEGFRLAQGPAPSVRALAFSTQMVTAVGLAVQEWIQDREENRQRQNEGPPRASAHDAQVMPRKIKL